MGRCPLEGPGASGHTFSRSLCQAGWEHCGHASLSQEPQEGKEVSTASPGACLGFSPISRHMRTTEMQKQLGCFRLCPLPRPHTGLRLCHKPATLPGDLCVASTKPKDRAEAGSIQWGDSWPGGRVVGGVDKVRAGRSHLAGGPG